MHVCTKNGMFLLHDGPFIPDLKNEFYLPIIIENSMRWPIVSKHMQDQLWVSDNGSWPAQM